MAITSRKFVAPEGWDNPASSFYGKGNYGQPDRPGLSTAEMQKVMDEIPRTVIAPAFNGLIDDLVTYIDGGSGADNIGATPVTGGTAHTVQGILEEIVDGGIVHAGSADTLNGYTIMSTLVDDDTQIPTSGAVVDAMASAGLGDMLKATYDPNNKEADAFNAVNHTFTDSNNFYTTDNVQAALNQISGGWHNITISTSTPTGGNNGDIWIVVT